ncbi:hypothetical protein [Salinactinospora qingdaonensis]|uniref:hypothetical protein n=1 Tax=Salinactinospora qingdaonensis TaxID=702744 RepID=UPI0031F00B7C
MSPRHGTGRTVGIVLAIVSVVAVLIIGGTATVVLLVPQPLLHAPVAPCSEPAETVSGDHHGGDLGYDGYATCKWRLTASDAGSDESFRLEVEYETITESVGGAQPTELARFLTRWYDDSYRETYGGYEVPTLTQIEDAGDEAYYVYRRYEGESYESASAYVFTRKGNVVITVSALSDSGSTAPPESQLRPVVEAMNGQALDQLAFEQA